MNAIVAVSRSWGIGKGNDLLFHISEDLKFFRRTTAGHTMVIGRKNLESFPGGKPLKNRRHMVLTTNPDYSCEGCEIYHTPEELLRAVAETDDEVWLCGGGEIYRLFLPYCEKALVTLVDADPESEVFFPNLEEEKGWNLTDEGPLMEADGITYRFTTWTNTSPQPLN